MSDHEENDGIPDDEWDWLEMVALAGLGMVMFFLVYLWAK